MMKPRSVPADAATLSDETRAAGLREEIDFWSGMLESSRDTAPSETVERMTFALALAEFRLRELTRRRSA
jgi:hypothetical protein